MGDLPLSMAFGITSEDVVTVYDSKYGITIDDEEAERLFDLLDQDLVAVEACKGGTDMDDQIEAAYDEIERQLDELGELN